MTAELTAIDWHIREHTRIAEANEHMAEHFAAKAADHRELADSYIAERNRYLGQTGVGNVIPLPSVESPGVA